jgi:hypothetical protein
MKLEQEYEALVDLIDQKETELEALRTALSRLIDTMEDEDDGTGKSTTENN